MGSDPASSRGDAAPRRRSATGVTLRLIALVMVPLTAMCVLAGSVVVTRQSTAHQAGIVDHGVLRLSELAGLRDALHTQQSALAFDVRFLQVGVTRAEASGFIGFDWTAQVAPARARASRAIAALGDRSPVSAVGLQSLYTQIDSLVLSPPEAVARLGDLIASTGTALTSGLDDLERNAHQAPVVAALESLRTATILVDAGTPQGIDLGVVWFPAPTDTAQSRATMLSQFGAESADYATAVARLRDLGVTSVVAALDRIEHDPGVQAFDVSVAESLLGKPLMVDGATFDNAKVATTFRGYVTRDGLLSGLVTTAAVAVGDQARHLAASERTAFLLWAFGTAVFALVSVGVALRLARSISKPLKDLAGYAHAVNEGDLDAEPPARHSHGPRETQMAIGVFTELVANLQLLDAKANALAHCAFDDPVLSRPLPGRLGRSLESSVALLSGSIVERDQLQTHLAYEATHDSLTGVGNRPAAIAAIQAALQRSARSGASTAVLFVDLNDFKAVNDSHGHEVGDEVLRQVAARMTVGLRTGDFLARLGGDEFIVVAEAVPDVAIATELARRIIESLSVPIDIAGLQITIGAAVGIALTLDGPEEPLRLLARADAAMYRAKGHETSAVEIFDVDLQRQMIEREDIETALATALADPTGGGLRLDYQPILTATTGALAGVEALIRWDRPGHGPLPPDSFIPIAEATRLIIDLDCWVLNQATRQLVAWSADPELAGISVAINISGRHLLSHQLAGHIATAVGFSGVDPHRLRIEITETVLLTDLIAAGAELDEVRALGVKVAIDDFGTGYTSLAHLQHLPIDTIKIDRSFVNQLHTGPGRSLIRMVTDLGHAIGIDITAEGVETIEQLRALRAVGADHVQGFFLSRPLRAAALAIWAQREVHAED